jgi:hypothetical protein
MPRLLSSLWRTTLFRRYTSGTEHTNRNPRYTRL